LRPSVASFVFIRQEDDQANWTGWNLWRDVGLQAMLVVDIAVEFKRFH
jgi:hypothetical protein